MPSPSQSTLLDAEVVARRRCSSSSRDSPGLRACTVSSRHSSVVSSVPSPLTSMLPPSSTTRRAAARRAAVSSTRAAARATRRRHRVVALPVVVLGPAVEPPVGRGQLARASSLHEDRAEVARPDAVGRHAHEVDARRGRRRPAPSMLARLLPRRRRSTTRMRTRSRGASCAHDLGVDPGDRRELARPVASLVRPGDPGRRVRLPLGGHAEAERCGEASGVAVAQSRNAAGDAARRRRCGGRAGRASCGAPPRCAPRSHSTTRISSSVARGLGEHDAERIARRTSRPRTRCRRSARALVADAIDRRDVDAVGDGVRALDRLPGVVLRRAVLGLLARVPADGGRVEEDLRALQRREPRGLGVPLVPADERADACRTWCRSARKPRSPGVK